MRSVAYRVLAGLFTVVAFLEGLDHALESAPPHRIHLLGHSVVSVALVLALGTQLLSSRPPAGLWLIALIGVGAGAGDLFGQRFGGLEVVCAVFLVVLLALHPQRATALSRPGPLDPLTAAVAVVAILAVLPYFVHQSSLQRSLVDPVHPDYGYWSWAATAPLVLALATLAAAWRPDGWPLLVGVASAGLLAVGGLSVMLPHEPSSLGIAGGLAALAGGVVVALVAGRRRTVPGRAWVPATH